MSGNVRGITFPKVKTDNGGTDIEDDEDDGGDGVQTIDSAKS